MWTCQKCGEDIDDVFDTCWKCGTSKGGAADPAFQQQDAPDGDGQARTSSEGRRHEDLACRECGHVLREVRRDSVCPECGTTVNWSAHGDLLRFSDPAWVRTLASGMGWIVAGIVCFIAAVVVTLTEQPGTFLGLSPLFGIPAALVTLVGYWQLTTPDPARIDTDAIFTARRLVRVTITTALVWNAMWAPVALAAALPLDPRFVQMLGQALGLLAIAALFGYVRHLALRFPNTRLASQSRLVALAVTLIVPAVPVWSLPHIVQHVFDQLLWMEPFLSKLCLVLALAFLILCLILAIWSFTLIVRCCKALHIAAAMAGELGTRNGSGKAGARTRATICVAGMVCALLVVSGGVAFIWSYHRINQLKKQLQDENPVVRRNAVRPLSHYGRAAVQPLIDALEDEDPKVRQAAAHTLGRRVGWPAVPALIALFNDEDARLRRWVAPPPIHGAEGKTPALFLALNPLTGELRGNLKVEAALNAALTDEDEVIRSYAASALGLQRPRDRLEEGLGGKPLSFWIDNLTHKDPNVRLWAVYYVVRAKGERPHFGELRAEAKAAVPVLIELLKHKDPSVRAWAASTLRQIGPDGKEAVPALVRALVDKERRVRRAATWALAQIGRGGDVWEDPRLVEAAVPALIEALKDKEARSAASALGQIGPKAKEAVRRSSRRGMTERSAFLLPKL